ncbi:AraC family transcriptional regulator [Herbaspirillum sp. YR522]|uniref:AraC family transcriptional regulator n=1 Tax=Herbaspirillum sp. YR522 TaxID=1144342 RepID=UPI00026F4AFB|nr:AraC family transcriptional regulator [Herbaspirillum sp. YR522]EJM99712.1 DNA-binding domain-containing protein, AraC-type [Herbaspirillum sp. YR522]
MTALDSLRAAIARHAPQDGTFACALAGVKLIRCSSPTMPMPVIYEPTVCFVAQGRKRATLGASVFHYDPASYLVATVGLPVVGAVIEASATEPYLSLQVDLDCPALEELALKHPAREHPVPTAPGLVMNDMTPDLINAATRLVTLLDSPADVDALGPLAMTEIFYRLLSAPNGGIVRAVTQSDSRHGQIARAILWIRAHFRDVFRIDEVAGLVGMSRSTFHAHFKTVTAMSPIEFRNQLRMQEARRLMVSDGLDAASAGYHVGYDSPSQFSRDYARVFGMAPGKHAGQLRAIDN